MSNRPGNDGEGSERGRSRGRESEAQSNAPAPAAANAESNAPSGPKDDRFYHHWDKFASKPPAPKKSTTLSLDVDTEDHPGHHPGKNAEGLTSSENAVVSYEEAAATCRSKVKAIVAECRRLNKKYYDPTFNLVSQDTLVSLAPGEFPASANETSGVGAVKRIEDIFEDPKFIVDGATASDVRQGRVGDCWFLAAVTALSGTEEPGQTKRLLTKLCVARDEKAGVYGFVFHRDGEWISEVVDDRLCLKNNHDMKQYICRIPYDQNLGSATLTGSNFEKLPSHIKDDLNTGSNTLFFSSCRDSDETWLPLLEKCYAKIHGDYQTIESGLAGEGIEDLTGGVNVSLDSEDILDKDILWEELLRVNQDFLFGCSSRRGTDEQPADDEGFVRGHAYTVLEAKEVDLHNGKKERLLKIRNPWAKQEWNGRWSDGSKEWTAEIMKQLNHTFGDDGIFWISFKDFLKYYPRMDRTRLFGSEWVVSQQWTSVNVPHHSDYLDTKFGLTVDKAGPVVIVLAQPDSRYFQSLEGRYTFQLHFRLYRDAEETYLVRSMGESGTGRSCSVELDVEPGQYSVLMKILATRTDAADTPVQVIRRYRRTRMEKLLSVGKHYDMTHSKGLLREKENENSTRRRKDAIKASKKKNASVMQAQRVANRDARRKAKLRYERRMKETQRRKDLKRGENQTTDDAELVNGLQETSLQENVDNSVEEIETVKEIAEGKDENGQETNEQGDAGEAEERAKAQNGEDDRNENENIGEQNGENNENEETNVEENNVEEEEVNEVEEEREVEEEVEEEIEENDAVSSVGDDEFDWDSDIDDPVDPIILPSDDETDDIFGDDPWNAVCVVGLRVYALGSGVKIQVVDR